MQATQIPDDPIIEFEVDERGSLRMANFAEAETRADFYEHLAG